MDIIYITELGLDRFSDDGRTISVTFFSILGAFTGGLAISYRYFATVVSPHKKSFKKTFSMSIFSIISASIAASMVSIVFIVVFGFLEFKNKNKFFQDILATAKTDKSFLILQMTKDIFDPKLDYLTFRIIVKKTFYLYCWIISDDRKAFILLPNPNNATSSRLPAGATRTYPQDFNFGNLSFNSPARDLCGCFALPNELPSSDRNRWMSTWNADGIAQQLEEDRILEFLSMMRSQPGVVEAYGYVIAR